MGLSVEAFRLAGFLALIWLWQGAGFHTRDPGFGEAALRQGGISPLPTLRLPRA
jgi:hypothetical protein